MISKKVKFQNQYFHQCATPLLTKQKSSQGKARLHWPQMQTLGDQREQQLQAEQGMCNGTGPRPILSPQPQAHTVCLENVGEAGKGERAETQEQY
jgi:hypothetical protein